MLKPIYAKFDLIGLEDIVNKTNKRVAQNEQRSYRRTVENWNEKPNFRIETTKSHSGGIDDFKVVTDSEKYLWIDEGTEPHQITPNGNYPLNVRGFGNTIFNGGQAYYPKTTQNKIVSNGVGEYEPDDIGLWGVTQSIEPRNFTIEILKKADKRWETALDTEIKKFVESNIK